MRCFTPLKSSYPVEAFEYDPVCKWSFKKGLNIFLSKDYQQEIHTNRIGSVNFQESFDGYRDSVFVLGDSFTQGSGLPADANYPFQLDLMLNLNNKRYTKDYAVVNLGQCGIGTRQAICILKKYSSCLRTPRFILYQGDESDYEDDVMYTKLAMALPFSGNPQVPCLIQWLVRHTETAATCFKFYIEHFRRKIASQIKNSDRAALQELVLDELKQTADALNAKLIVTWAEPDPEGSYRWLQSWAMKNGVAFADWRPEVKSTEQAIPDIPFGNHHSAGHYRTWVNYVIAKSFFEKIQQFKQFELNK